MKPALQIIPLALLFGGAVVAVWRGLDTRSDRTPNRAKGAVKKRKWWG